ncbi:unnamed protein product [Moneuplotes crassus]|uniref:Uncharacterized protein n=1 Tax=Euplotes crassus TaxID=5936 RepID=A0AAD1UMS4_EUPCR|nr:unnamed protein product [Moneuplotes crassus]
MCDKIFKMRKDNYILMGMPIEILNKKYKRKAIEFNLGFFLTEQAGSTKSERQKDIEVYSKILKKIGEKLTELELESEFIWNETKKVKLEGVVKDLYNQLQNSYDCFIKIDEFNCINFKFEKIKETSKKDSEEKKFENIAKGIRKDSLNSTADSKRKTSMLARLITRFHFSNVYKCTPRLLEFIKSPEKQRECFEYITYGKKEFGLKNVFEADLDIIIDPTDKNSSFIDKDEDYFTREEKSGDFSEAMEYTINVGLELVQLYTRICNSQLTVENFILHYVSELVNQENINLFIDYGIQNGYVKKCNQYTKHKKLLWNLLTTIRRYSSCLVLYGLHSYLSVTHGDIFAFSASSLF